MGEGELWIHRELRGDVLILRMGRAPVNAIDHALRKQLFDAIAQAEADPAVAALVLTGTGDVFSAGADTSEFGKPAQLQEPLLATLVTRIEECTKPVVAAVRGHALGGGLELVLACHARVFHADAQLGLPEVRLGLIPGAGGTQRLPRLVGLSAAYEWMRSAAKCPSSEYVGTALVTAISSDVIETAVERAKVLASAGHWTRSGSIQLNPAAVVEFAEAQETKLSRRERLQPALLSLIEAVRASALPLRDGLARERALFLELCASAESAALRRLERAERSAKGRRARGAEKGRLAVIGAGTMGAGIAFSALKAGLDVVVLEKEHESIRAGRDRILALGDTHSALGERLLVTDDWSSLGGCHTVIEAIFEEMALKRAVFERIDHHAPAGAMLATNTSYLNVNRIAGATRRPESVVGLHFFSPAHRMPLLEVVRGEKTDQSIVERARDLANRLGKLPVVVGNGFGFVGNRLFQAYRRQCEFLLEDGAWPEEVDDALESFGFAMGPFAVADLSGLDVAWRMRQARATQRKQGERYVSIPDRLCELGRLGRKTGAGYYDYGAQGRSPQTDDVVRGVIRQARTERGARRTVDAAAIVERAMAAMVNEAAWVLHEGVADSASDIDLILVNGFGFPRWKGGPVCWACQQPRPWLDGALERLKATDPIGISIAPKAMMDRLLEA